jgi:hypothetical protein
VSFAAGETSKTITLNVQGDLTSRATRPCRWSSAPGERHHPAGRRQQEHHPAHRRRQLQHQHLTTTRAEGNTDSTVTYTVTRSGSSTAPAT